MAQVGSLVVDLIAQTASFNSNITKAAQNLSSQSATMQRSLQKIEAAASFTSNGIKALATSFVGLGALRVGQAALDYASGLGEISQQIGVTVEDLQVYRYAATQVGVSQEEMEKGLGKLTQTLGKAQLGSAASAEVFSALGVSIRDAGGKLRTTSDILPDLADAIGRIPDPAKRAAIEVALFGRAGQKLDTLLSGGSNAVKAQAAELSSYGIVTEEMAGKADAAADKIAQMKFILETKLAIGVSENADVILRLADGLGQLAQAAINAYRAYSNFRNIRGFDLATDPRPAVANLTSTASGRQALARNIQNKIDDNMRRRSAGEGDAGQLDREFKQLNRQRNALVRINNAAKRINDAPAPKPTSLLGSDSDIPAFMASGGGKPKGGGSPKPKSDDGAAKLIADAKAYSDELAQQLELADLRNQGFAYTADILEAQYEVEQRFPKLAKETNDQYQARIAPLIAGKKALIDQAEAVNAIKVDLDTPLQLDALSSSQIDGEWNKTLKSLGIDTDSTTKQMSQSFTEMASNVNQALSSLASGIRSGGFLDILGGVLNLVTQLGSAGIFGKSVATKLNSSTSRGFSSGGYTGAFGVGDVAGVVHGQEYVFDAQSVRRIGLPALDNLRKGKVPGFKSGGFVGSASVGNYMNRPGVNDNALRVQVVKGDLFDVIVDGRAANVAAPMVVAGSQAASVGAQRAVARKNSRRLA